MNIKVYTENGGFQFESDAGKSILDILKENDIYVPAYCNGRGACGKCGILLEEGHLDITAEDRQVYDADQLASGYRLSCRAYPEEDVVIRLMTSDEDDFEVLSSSGAHTADTADDGAEKVLKNHVDGGTYGIAVDIGTTTISMDLMHLSDGTVVTSNNRINRQRAFGADVISRIQASVNGEKEALRQSIVRDLTEGFEGMVRDSGVPPACIRKIVIGANTTMCHLLLGYDCDTLGVFPFEPVNIKTVRKAYADVFDSDFLSAEVIVLPGISTYVGADISAGLLTCGFDTSEKKIMLIDLGTNGEMALGDRNRLICTSTAAGPAFEGGNISCGTGSVRGAICAVKMSDEGTIEYSTIADGEPVGICGTGVLDITAELVAHDIVDETGLLDDDYFDDGLLIAKSKLGEDIVFTQKDVREIQLAKAAVRAGIEVLVKRSGITMEDVDTVYLAGGFGFRLDIEKAVSIGLIPEAFADKIQIAGNTSLKGAAQCLMDEHQIEVMERMIDRCDEISLGSDADFNNAYMDAMYFES